MSQTAVRQGETVFDGRPERERLHFNRVSRRAGIHSLRMPEENIRRYDNPPATTPFPLVYAFHLLGPLNGKTVVDLGCGNGLNTVILAALGAQVIAVDISNESLRLTELRASVNGVHPNVTFIHTDAAGIPLEDNSADLVLCAAILHHVDTKATANQIRRILKPGGRAAFSEPMLGPPLFAAVKARLPRGTGVSDDEMPLTHAQVMEVSSTIGRHGRSRVFGVTMRLVSRAGIQSRPVVQGAHQFDAWILRIIPGLRRFASPLVWEAVKADA